MNRARDLLPQLNAAYRGKDLATFDRLTAQWFAAMDLTTEVLSNQPENSLSAWVSDARRWSGSKVDQDAYEFDAKSLVTVWGSCEGEGPVNNDYANRDWPEMITGYYKPRWAEYLARARAAIIGGGDVGKASYCKAAMDWSRRPGVEPAAPTMTLDQAVRKVIDLE